MSSIKKSMLQTGVNVTTELAIPTLLTVDGKSGWNILGMNLILSGLGPAVVPTTDAQALVELNTEAGVQNFDDPDNIIFHQFQFSGIAASTSGYQVFNTVQHTLILPRLTVQPNLYLNLSTSGLAQVLTVNVEIVYETVRLTDVEVMRLMQGGA